jgi:hypothetical protein
MIYQFDSFIKSKARTEVILESELVKPVWPIFCFAICFKASSAIELTF